MPAEVPPLWLRLGAAARSGELTDALLAGAVRLVVTSADDRLRLRTAAALAFAALPEDLEAAAELLVPVVVACDQVDAGLPDTELVERYVEALRAVALEGIRERERLAQRARRHPELELDEEHVGDDPTEQLLDALEPPALAAPLADRWRALVEAAGPRQRQLLEAWHERPDAPLAEIARELGITPVAARNAVARLRRRAS